jgi:hypothetical protein
MVPNTHVYAAVVLAWTSLVSAHSGRSLFRLISTSPHADIQTNSNMAPVHVGF